MSAQPKKPKNPWMIIGWILLGVVTLFIGSCALLIFGAVGIPQYQDYVKRSQEAQVRAENTQSADPSMSTQTSSEQNSEITPISKLGIRLTHQQ